MNSHPSRGNFNKNLDPPVTRANGDPGLRRFADRLHQSMQRDTLIQNTTDSLREFLGVDRVFLYYFYQQWQGQVTFESVSYDKFSIYGLSADDECFNNKYANLYQAGRVRAIANVELDPIPPSYKQFLQNLQVCASLVVPVLYHEKLWGLLMAHHCQGIRLWLAPEVEAMRKGAKIIETAASNRK